MEFLTFYSIAPLISSILFLLTGILIYLKNRRAAINIAFGRICFVTFWWQFLWFILFNTQNEVLAGYLVKINYMGIIFIPIFFFHFFLSFLKKVSRFDRYLLYFSYLMGLIFEVILLTTNYFIDGFYKYSWGFYPKAGPLHSLYLLLLAALTIRIFYLLFFSLKKTREISPIEHRQTKYILLALVFYVLASFDFFVNYGMEFYPFGFLFILIFLGIIAFTIAKYHLFEIKVLLTEFLVVVMGIILLVMPFLIEILWLKVLLFVVFLLFCFIGYLLIRYTRREAKQKEILEQKIQGRTKKIRKQLDELRRWHQGTINRELKMIELKKEIKEKEERIQELEKNKI